MPDRSSPNESAATLAWLARSLELEGDDPSSPVSMAWNEIRQRMLDVAHGGQGILYMQDWISDPWLARNARAMLFPTLVPVWDPPELLAEWPTLGARAVIARSTHAARQTNHQTFLDLLTEARAPAAPDAGRAIDSFFAMNAAIGQHGDLRMVQIEHVRAWLGTSVGHLLMSIVLTPPVQPEALVEVTLARLAMPRQIGLPSQWINDIEDRHLELLYNSRMRPDGVWTSALRVGQGEEWREHWRWLSRDVAPAATLEALHLAAGLMRSPPLAKGLLEAVRSGDESLKTLAVAVIRRWILTLKTMAWLEVALVRPWTHVRTQDLCCFAFNATKPEWPRRVIGVSHRSADAKATLMDMKLWHSARCAIDANYVPSWETNTGMVWSLFAATPAIARVRSPRYEQSIWCQREAELSEYLAERSDFLSERWVLDVELSELRELDRLAMAWDDIDKPGAAASGLFAEFPPMCQVWTPTAMPQWEVKMLRASAALRLINVFVSDPGLANGLALLLLSDADLPDPAPTNNPDGWLAYASILREARLGDGVGHGELAVRLPSDYPPEQRARDLELSERIPDLSAGTPALGDVLVALEWLRVEWPAMLDQNRGDMIAINCRGLSKEQWEMDDRLSLVRGLAAFRVSGPLWILQLAGQDVETWPLMGEHPIFTEYVPAQFRWMFEISLDRRDSQARYPDESGLILSSDLQERCRAGRGEEAAP
jgi:hypothetical protein